MLKPITDYFKKILTKIFGGKPTVSNTDSNGNINLSGNDNNNSNNNNNNVTNNQTIDNFQAENQINNIYNNINNMYNNIKEDKIKYKKDMFRLKNELYDNMLKYRNEVAAIDPLHLFLIDDNSAYKEKIRAINANINEAIELLKEDYPELCNIAKKVSSDISSYYATAVIYGKMKFDNINSGPHYNDVCKRMDQKIANLDKSIADYITEHRK
ncbi:hypothetical protein EFM10_01800 [Lactobacillus helveticus]|uniref:hypothetical protein n=1 Tax=Lactobacillus helveticus TaxID=1587 RepID=UPI002181F7BC|nr:hypothetical protein [Lactobacillus helveticus]MCT0192021.1 hypothetical protein [Lactobacillus helveticus]